MNIKTTLCAYWEAATENISKFRIQAFVIISIRSMTRNSFRSNIKYKGEHEFTVVFGGENTKLES